MRPSAEMRSSPLDGFWNEMSDTCRLCAGISVPGLDLLDPKYERLSKWIEKNLSYEISLDNGFPTRMCHPCHSAIQKWMAFKQRIRVAWSNISPAAQNALAASGFNSKKIFELLDEPTEENINILISGKLPEPSEPMESEDCSTVTGIMIRPSNKSQNSSSTPRRIDLVTAKSKKTSVPKPSTSGASTSTEITPTTSKSTIASPASAKLNGTSSLTSPKSSGGIKRPTSLDNWLNSIPAKLKSILPPPSTTHSPTKRLRTYSSSSEESVECISVKQNLYNKVAKEFPQLKGLSIPLTPISQEEIARLTRLVTIKQEPKDPEELSKKQRAPLSRLRGTARLRARIESDDSDAADDPGEFHGAASSDEETPVKLEVKEEPPSPTSAIKNIENLIKEEEEEDQKTNVISLGRSLMHMLENQVMPVVGELKEEVENEEQTDKPRAKIGPASKIKRESKVQEMPAKKKIGPASKVRPSVVSEVIDFLAQEKPPTKQQGEPAKKKIGPASEMKPTEKNQEGSAKKKIGPASRVKRVTSTESEETVSAKKKIGPASRVRRNSVEAEDDMPVKRKIGPASRVSRENSEELGEITDVPIKKKKIGPASRVQRENSAEPGEVTDVPIKKKKIGPASRVQRENSEEPGEVTDVLIKKKKIGPASRVQRVNSDEPGEVPDFLAGTAKKKKIGPASRVQQDTAEEPVKRKIGPASKVRAADSQSKAHQGTMLSYFTKTKEAAEQTAKPDRSGGRAAEDSYQGNQQKGGPKYARYQSGPWSDEEEEGEGSVATTTCVMCRKSVPSSLLSKHACFLKQ